MRIISQYRPLLSRSAFSFLISFWALCIGSLRVARYPSWVCHWTEMATNSKARPDSSGEKGYMRLPLPGSSRTLRQNGPLIVHPRRGFGFPFPI